MSRRLEPTTAAGRSTVVDLANRDGGGVPTTALLSYWGERIAAIEAEARQQDGAALRREVGLVCDAYGDKGWAKSAMVRRLRAALAARAEWGQGQ